MSRPEWVVASDVMKKLAEHARKFMDLSIIQVLPVPTPEGHPDLDTWDADMAALARLSREVWIKAMQVGGGIELGPTIWDDMQLDLHVLEVAIGAAELDYIADDIGRWKAGIP